MIRAFYDEDADPEALRGETVAVLGYGIQGRAQAQNFRDSGVGVVVGNRDDDYRRRAAEDGFAAVDPAQATHRATILVVLVPDEVQPAFLDEHVLPHLRPGQALVFAHGFSVRYGLVRPPDNVDVLLCAPRMPGRYVRQRYLDGWGVPAFVAVHRDASGRAWPRLLALARAQGFTRCAALEVGFDQETELDLFSEHFTYPLVFRALEVAFQTLVERGYPPEAALMELHGSGELGQVLTAAAREGLFGMIASHASPACQVGIATHWEDADLREQAERALQGIADGSFASYLGGQQERGYPDLKRWARARPSLLVETETRLRGLLRGLTPGPEGKAAPEARPQPGCAGQHHEEDPHA